MFLEPTEAWQILGLCTALVIAFLLAVHFTKLKMKVPLFYSWIGAIAIFGGALAFLLPLALNSGFGKDDDGRILRQLILYTTGGVLGVITLGESHRKNNQEKEKNENDHTRQVYAERRSRYTKAIEQLADEKAAVRLGGIYTLAGLVDEWLADNSLQPYEQRKEGQVIINNLCAYIRSPFPLALKAETLEADSEPDNYEGDFSKDQATFHEEQDVRRAIFIEMSKRSSTLARDKKGKVFDTFPGLWSDFDFNFSRASIFYPLSNLTIEKAFFSSCRFYGDANFVNTVFTQNANFWEATFTQNVSFALATFTQNAEFTKATFVQNTDFIRVTFVQSATFCETIFTQKTNFAEATFIQNANFWGTTFTQNANFRGTTFTQDADFREAIFTQDAGFLRTTFGQSAGFTKATFTQNANFLRTTFTQTAGFTKATFTQNANFQGATFIQNADFAKATFTQNANFWGAIFTQNANFLETLFTQNAIFRRAVFAQNTNFHDAYFKNIEPTFALGNSGALFSVLTDPSNYVFKVNFDSTQSISTEQITVADGQVFTIPVGCELFDPEPLPAPKPEEHTK